MADRWGVAHSYTDAGGRRRRIGRSTVERLHDVIGEPSEEPGPVILRAGKPLDRPGADLVLEDGTELRLTEPCTDLPLGYHRILERGAVRQLIVAPARCHPSGPRSWGWAAQVYATRSERSWGFGDLADLGTLGRWATELGAGYVLTNPMGAALRGNRIEPSPYSPSTRRFLDPLYLRIEDVPGAAALADRLAPIAEAGRSLNRIREIDRDSVWHHKSTALELLWDQRAGADDFEAWFEAAPADVVRFATWTALVELHGPEWRTWPASLRHPGGAGVALATHDLADRVRFHAWQQWLLRRQFDDAARSAPIMGDLTIGVSPHGFDAWDWQDVLALDVSVGAPPDELSADGQDWGLPPFVPWKLRAAGYRPFIDTLRAAFRSAGGLRIDHVMGLFRLWWIPAGESPSAGAFVENRADDLLALLALESHRAGAAVVGEDLGTVLASARRKLAANDILSYRLLWFEDDPPEQWPARAMAAVTTHDLPTVAGLWSGSDVAEQRRLGLSPNEASFAQMRNRLSVDAGLAPEATAEDAVSGAHRLLARAPSAMITVTLDDAVAEPERPNIPGADGHRPNWSLALPIALEQIERHPLAVTIAETLNDAVAETGDDPDEPRRAGLGVAPAGSPTR